MGIYTINKAQWDDTAHACVLLDVTNNETGGRFTYAVRENDPAPLNQELWAIIMAEPESILPIEVELIISGAKELPPGKTLIDMTLYDDEEQKAAMRGAVNRRLAELTMPEITARAEIDPDFKALRAENMRELLAVEKQPGFPYGIEWPEQIV
jgi:hypothetical protein